MTGIGTQIGTLLAAGAVALAGVLGADSSRPGLPGAPTALVVDASMARDGRQLVDPRLDSVDAELRLPRTAAEARTNVRYFAALGYRLVVAGRHADSAAYSGGIAAVRAPHLAGALAALER
ncbi:MAG TPA: hypothetical protein VE270_04585 [Thermoleophilaceae bacterium]|nr:hypothetical protein [Thermoleophilaceae bacterium]